MSGITKLSKEYSNSLYAYSSSCGYYLYEDNKKRWRFDAKKIPTCRRLFLEDSKEYLLPWEFLE